MLSPDAVTNLLLSLNKYCLKRGDDLQCRRELQDAIEAVTDTEGYLDAIYVNNVDNYLIPDVSVLHLYDNNFSHWLLDPDSNDTHPYGYTIEIHERCFTKYTEEELAALIIHHMLQNVLSDTAKVRFMKAYTAVTTKYETDKMLDLFEGLSIDEVLFMAFTEICLRPFQVPADQGYDFVATDEVLKTIGLADAYDSYLEKVLPMSDDTVEHRMDQELKDDYRDMDTIIKACLDKDIRHYYNMVRTGVPLVTLEHLLGSRQSTNSLGFNSRKIMRRPVRGRNVALGESAMLNESLNDPSNELEIRFQIDKIINSMRYAESEAEREVILFKIKRFSMKLAKSERNYKKELSKHPQDDNLKRKLKFIQACLGELEDLRKQTMKMEIKTKHWRVYVKDSMPTGYEF